MVDPVYGIDWIPPVPLMVTDAIMQNAGEMIVADFSCKTCGLRPSIVHQNHDEFTVDLREHDCGEESVRQVLES